MYPKRETTVIVVESRLLEAGRTIAFSHRKQPRSSLQVAESEKMGDAALYLYAAVIAESKDRRTKTPSTSIAPPLLLEAQMFMVLILPFSKS